MTYFLLTTLIFVCLKLFHQINWSWVYVVSPSAIFLVWVLIKSFYDLIFNRADNGKDDGYA